MSETTIRNIKNFADVARLYGGTVFLGGGVETVSLTFPTVDHYENFRQHVGRALDISEGRGRINEPNVSATLHKLRSDASSYDHGVAYNRELGYGLSDEEHAELERQNMAHYRETMAATLKVAARNSQHPIARVCEAVDRAAVRFWNWLRLR